MLMTSLTRDDDALGSIKVEVEERQTDREREYRPFSTRLLLFLFVKRLHSNLNIMSLVAVKKRKKWE